MGRKKSRKNPSVRNKLRIARSAAGLNLEPHWVRLLIEEGYEYVFTSIPVQAYEPAPKFVKKFVKGSLFGIQIPYKGPKLSGKSKTRVENEVVFRDPDSMTSILNNLGFEVVGEINKTRIIYKINDIETCLDIVDGLGNFVELEMKGMDKEQGEKELFGLAEKLGLSGFERKSYLELHNDKVDKNSNL